MANQGLFPPDLTGVARAAALLGQGAAGSSPPVCLASWWWGCSCCWRPPSLVCTSHRRLSDELVVLVVAPCTCLHLPEDAVFSIFNQMNKGHAKCLKKLYPSLRAIAVAGCKNHELDTLDLLASCLAASPSAQVHWHKSYISHLSETVESLLTTFSGISLGRETPSSAFPASLATPQPIPL